MKFITCNNHLQSIASEEVEINVFTVYPVEQCTMEFVIEFEGSNLTNPVEIPVKLIQEGQEVTKLAKTILEGQNLVWTHRNDEVSI